MIEHGGDIENQRELIEDRSCDITNLAHHLRQKLIRQERKAHLRKEIAYHIVSMELICVRINAPKKVRSIWVSRVLD